jgi:superfamily II DNA or RNA helicase
MNLSRGSVRTLEQLCTASLGGTVTLQITPQIRSKVSKTYSDAIGELDIFEFWRKGEASDYRPEQGLWLPQRRAVAFAHAYLSVRQHQSSGEEAALIKMPTGTGKTAVIAVLACGSPLIRKTLILTPRAGLVRQMKHDLSFRFWGRALDAAYFDCKIHENMKKEEIDRIESEVRKGITAPVRELIADQYKNVWLERNQERQILVSTFNALHLVLGIEPPAHRSMHGREPRDVALSLQLLGKSESETDQQIKERNVKAFRNLVRSVDLVIVDEGHYEPAYSWRQAVNAISKPTVIFSATPYRNDYKYFQIAGHYVFNLPWQEAVYERLVRDVRVKPAVKSAQKGKRGKQGQAAVPAASGYNERSFVSEFAETLARLPDGKRVIVHASTYQSLQRLQRAFYSEGAAAVLIHDAFTGAEKACLDLKDLSAEAQEILKKLRFQHVRQTEGNADAQAARIWLHQYKLLEGIDDSRFTEVWLYDGFGSARQLVQQIGRAIRRPDLTDRHGQLAIIRGCSKRLDVYEGAPTVLEQVCQRWQDYLGYEDYAAKKSELAFTAETQLLAVIKRTAPAVQYIAGEFRGGHLLDQSPTMSAFLLPRRGVVCRVQGITEHKAGAISEEFLRRLESASSEAMLLEERFDVAPVPAPSAGEYYRDVRLIRYLAWSNSPYLAHHHLPEWKLGVMAIVRAGRYIFILDTEGICIDYSRVGLLSPEPEELKRLFRKASGGRPGPGARNPTRIVETTASGLDISELGLRSISVRKHALDEGYFDLAEASQVPTSVRGFGQLGRETARRRLSFAHSSVADATNALLAVKNYVDWARTIGDAMADDKIEPHRYFDRFAREIRPLDTVAGIPRSILLDLWDVLDVSSETVGERHWNKDAVDEILNYDTCCEVEERQMRGGAPPRYFFTFGPHEMEIKYIYRDTVPPSGRYAISGVELNGALADAEDDSDREIDPDNRMFGRRLSTSLTRLINQEQAFRIIPSKRGVVYSHSHFYAPDVNEAVFSILEPCDALDNIVSEKGDTRLADPSQWSRSTLFGLVYSWFEGADTGGNEFAEDIKSCATVICDDRADETADFYGIDDMARRVLVVHAKAEDGTPGVSARKLQEVTRQAQASLAFAGSSRREFPFPQKWKNDWEVTLKHASGAKIARPRLVTRDTLDIRTAYDRLTGTLANPGYKKEVVMLTAGILSDGAARRARSSNDPRDLQFLYFLASVRSTFDRAGVRYRLVCNR